jgi:hypothetical protein
MPRSLSFTIYKATLFLLFISSMYPWFLWNISLIFMIFLGAFVSAIFYFLNKKQFEITTLKLLLAILLVITLGWCAINANINGAIGRFLLLITILLLINTKDELKADIFKYITNGMAILVGVSLLLYILFLIGVPLPHNTLRDSNEGYGGYNYYGFIIQKDVWEYYRFNSIFAEPGHLSMGLILLLYINRLNLRNKSVLVLFIAELFTLSLAGYIILTTSIVIYSFSRSKTNRFAKILLIFLIFFSMFLLVRLNKDNVINKAIVARLEYDDTKGTIAGYNRTNEYTNMCYNNFIKSSDFLFGMGYKKSPSATYGSAGYKVYMMQFGLIGTILVVLFYLTYALVYRKYEVWGLLLILIMLLFQNAYPFWFTIVFGYVLGVSKLYNKQIPLKLNRLLLKL